MPISEKTVVKIFMVSRTAYSVVVMKVASRWGCLIWTAMNSSPPATADRPAARRSLVVVIIMCDSLVRRLARRPPRGGGTYDSPTRTCPPTRLSMEQWLEDWKTDNIELLTWAEIHERTRGRLRGTNAQY